MIKPFEIPCVILCGGKSSRMGEDKALLPFCNSNSLAQYQYDRLKPYFKDIYISSKTNKFDFPINLIADKEEQIYSPIVALNSVFDSLEAKEVFIITVDTPLVTLETISKLIEESAEYDICVGKTQRVHNLCGIFKDTSKNIIQQMLKEDIHKVGYLLKKLKTNYVQFDNNDEFINLNDKNEYERAKDIIS